MKPRITFFILALVLTVANQCLAQRNATLIKISPQHFLSSTIKLNIERGLSQSISININPSYSMLNKKYESAYGPGLEVGCKKYFKIREDKQLTGFYISGNLFYQYFDAEYKHHSRYTSWGIPYTISDSVFIPETIQRWGGDISLGYQLSSNRFYMDFYAGVSCKKGSSSVGKDSGFRKDSWAYYYSDNVVLPKIGFTLGMRIN